MAALGRWALLLLLHCLLDAATAVMLRQGGAEGGAGGQPRPPEEHETPEAARVDGIRIDELETPTSFLNKMWAKVWQAQDKADLQILNFSDAGMCFPPPLKNVVTKNWDKIERNVEQGRRLAADTKVIFAGLLRNAAEAVFPAYINLMMLARQFKDYHFFLMENDSDDGTPRWLKVVGRTDPKWEFKSEKLALQNDRGVSLARFERMANLRNRLRDWIETHVRQSPGWDLIVMIDFDIFRYGPFALSTHSFFASLGRPETARKKWDMMCANGLYQRQDVPNAYGMYDCFAFRTESNDTFNAHWCGASKEVGLKLWEGYDLVPVHSCFGGLTMYRSDAYFKCRYDPSVYDCEHVVLHKCMRDHGSKGRMFMDQLLTTNYDAFVHQRCVASKDWA